MYKLVYIVVVGGLPLKRSLRLCFKVPVTFYSLSFLCPCWNKMWHFILTLFGEWFSFRFVRCFSHFSISKRWFIPSERHLDIDTFIDHHSLWIIPRLRIARLNRGSEHCHSSNLLQLKTKKQHLWKDQSQNFCFCIYSLTIFPTPQGHEIKIQNIRRLTKINW